MTTEPKPNETCARCGAAFTCGSKAGDEKCWCFGLPPVMPLSSDACLCPACLGEEIARRQAEKGNVLP